MMPLELSISDTTIWSVTLVLSIMILEESFDNCNVFIVKVTVGPCISSANTYFIWLFSHVAIKPYRNKLSIKKQELLRSYLFIRLNPEQMTKNFCYENVLENQNFENFFS
jgi:hypothetical protein